MKVNRKMRKILPSLILVAVLAAVPLLSLAQPVDSCTLRHDLSDFDAACIKGATVSEAETKSWGMCCMLDAVYTVVDWVFFVLVAVVALLTIFGGFTISTAGGDPEKVNKGRDYILYAMIGLAVALLSRAVPSVVAGLIGG